MRTSFEYPPYVLPATRLLPPPRVAWVPRAFQMRRQGMGEQSREPSSQSQNVLEKKETLGLCGSAVKGTFFMTFLAGLLEE